MTPLESQSYDALISVMHYLTSRIRHKEEFLDVMGKLRNVIVCYENYKSGCPTGKHASFCNCQPAIVGVSQPEPLRKDYKR